MDVHWGCAGGVVLGGLGLPSLVVEPLEAAQHEEVVGPLAKVGPAVALEGPVSIVGPHPLFNGQRVFWGIGFLHRENWAWPLVLPVE